MTNLPPSPREAGSFAHVEALFAALSARPADERHDALQAISDVTVRERVRALLAAHDRISASDVDTAVDTPLANGPAAGDLVGAYRLIEKVGVGGMGEVFRAERADGVFTQQVAVKVTRANVGHPDLLRRFAIERQILASLNHPNIVGLLDGGATSTGQAYLIMEFLEGEAVTRYAQAKQLTIQARLQLFCSICSAVQHAHQHGIVHRDLKPANILVDGQGAVKVVDFGIAKLLESPHASAAATVAMLPGPLTPNYASPEQLRGLPVTTASDVYALGVVLYELLAGRRPYETDGQPLDRVLELVVGEEPPRPSNAGEAVSKSAATPYPPARLRGDLDAIVLKAMSKDPAARYGSAGELAADIQRWLGGDPVLARARSTAYVLRRLAGRHRTVVATAAVALLAVLVALGIAAWQWQSARSAQLRAEQRLRDVRQLANSLIFKIQDAVTPLPGSTPVRRTIVDEALQYLTRLEEDAATDPSLRLELAQAHRQLGNVLGNPQVANLGDRAGAIAQYERARTLLQPLSSGSSVHYDVVTSVVHTNVTLATLYAAGGDIDKARQTARGALDYISAYRTAHPNEPRTDRLIGQALFSVAWSSPSAQMTEAWQAALDHYEQMLSKSPTDAEIQRNVALVGKYLGGILESRGNYAVARQVYERSLELDLARLKSTPDRRDVQFDAAISYSNAASVAERLSDVAAARTLFEQSIALRRRTSEADPENVQAAGRLGYILWRTAQFYKEVDEPARGVILARESVQRLEQLRSKANEGFTVRDLAEALRLVAILETAIGNRTAGCAALTKLGRLLRDASTQVTADQHQRLDTWVLEQQTLCRQPPA
jgi:non-specific serine/threonine protein kinase/serine/threonine-protein kinase